MQTRKLHFIRHGQTDGSAAGQYIGKTDLVLSPGGAADIIAVAKEGRYPSVQRVYTAPHIRCRQTAAVCYPGKNTWDIPELAEYDFGSFEGKTMAELHALWPEEYRQWMAGGPQAAPPGGETGEQFLSRLASGLDYIMKEMSGDGLESAAVVVSGGVMSALLAGCGFPRKPPSQWNAGYGMGYTVLVTPALWMRGKIFEVYGLLPVFPGEENAAFGSRDTVSMVPLDGEV